MNLPNRLTVARIGLTGLFVVALLLPGIPYGKTAALALFIVASLTDWYDGWLARRNRQETAFGALLDPVADKILTSAAFICLIEPPALPFHPDGAPLVRSWMTLLIVAREFLVTGLRLVARERGVVLQADGPGKYKTAAQMFTIIVILVGYAVREEWLGGDPRRFDIAFARLTYWLMMGTMTLTVWSGLSVFWKNREAFLRDA